MWPQTASSLEFGKRGAGGQGKAEAGRGGETDPRGRSSRTCTQASPPRISGIGVRAAAAWGSGWLGAPCDCDRSPAKGENHQCEQKHTQRGHLDPSPPRTSHQRLRNATSSCVNKRGWLRQMRGLEKTEQWLPAGAWIPAHVRGREAPWDTGWKLWAQKKSSVRGPEGERK